MPLKASTKLTYSDHFILSVLMKLQARTRPVTTKAIAALAGIPYGTTKGRIEALKEAGIIRQFGPGRRHGHYYKVLQTIPELEPPKRQRRNQPR